MLFAVNTKKIAHKSLNPKWTIFHIKWLLSNARSVIPALDMKILANGVEMMNGQQVKNLPDAGFSGMNFKVVRR